jgi:hypothetical protein
MTDLTAILATIEADDMVRSVKKWQSGKIVRHYITLSEGGAADCKIWAEPKSGRIICDFGRRGCSPAYSKALGAFEALLAPHGTITRAYKDAPDFTFTVAEG